MTERKPPDITFASWIDQQIDEAARRGAFDNLPGAGKPLPGKEEDAAQAWLRDYLRREGVSPDELLPAPLRLRKEIERLAETVPQMRSEDEVREVVGELNRRIVQWRRIPEGPPVFLRLVDADEMVARWRAAQLAAQPAPEPGPPPLPADGDQPTGTLRRRPRWWRRRRCGPAAVRRAARLVRRRHAGWHSARRPAARWRRGRRWAARCRTRSRG